MADSIWDRISCATGPQNPNDPANCGKPVVVCGELAPSEQLLYMYASLMERMDTLERLYCECQGGGSAPEPAGLSYSGFIPTEDYGSQYSEQH